MKNGTGICVEIQVALIDGNEQQTPFRNIPSLHPYGISFLPEGAEGQRSAV